MFISIGLGDSEACFLPPETAFASLWCFHKVVISNQRQRNQLLRKPITDY